MADQWEYFVIGLQAQSYRDGHYWEVVPLSAEGQVLVANAKNATTELNAIGAQEWELVGTVSQSHPHNDGHAALIFKRRKP